MLQIRRLITDDQLPADSRVGSGQSLIVAESLTESGGNVWHYWHFFNTECATLSFAVCIVEERSQLLLWSTLCVFPAYDSYQLAQVILGSTT